jgi:hypothetical protein
MLRSALIAGLALAAQPVLADGPAKTPAPATAPKALTQLFISPMGEPFRATADAPYPSAAWFKGANTSGDGAMTKAEFMADAQRFFKVLDTDGDGVIDEAEITVYETKIAPEVNIGVNETSALGPQKFDYDQYRAPDGSPAEVHVDHASLIPDEREHDAAKAYNRIASRRGAGIFGFIDQPEPVRAADIHINFRITNKDWVTAAEQRFDALDVKRQGKLVLSELPKTPYQLVLERRK